jgi:hypothetical protein
MLDFFSFVCKNDIDRFPMADPQTTLLFLMSLFMDEHLQP